MDSGSGRSIDYRIGYRDIATGTWTEGATAPAGAVIGWWDESRQVWVEGIPEGRGITARQQVIETRDTYVVPEAPAKKFNIWPWLLGALAAAALIFFLARGRGVPEPAAVIATPGMEVATEVVDVTVEAPAAVTEVVEVATEEAAVVDAAVTEVADAAAMVAGCTPKVVAPDAFITGLKDAKLPIGDTVLYTADNDPDGLLGKDGGYDSAFGFTDTRLDKADGVAGGGVIEFFKNPEAAKARAEAAATTAKDEIRSFFGPIMVRLSGKMSADQAKEYTSAIGTLTGCEMGG